MPELTALSVEFLSLVKRPATGKTLTLKNRRGRAQSFALEKTDDELMIAYGVVYAPGEVDAHGDTADARTIRRAAQEFMREARLKNIDTEHSFAPEMAFVAESWIVRAGDPLFPGEPEGAWAVGIQIGDPEIWRQLKSGELTGISLAGVARIDPGEAPDPARWTEKGLVAALKRLLGKCEDPPDTSNPEETDMDDDKVRDIVRETVAKEVGPAVTTALKAAGIGRTEPEAAPKPEAPDLVAAIKAAMTEALEGQAKTIGDTVAKAVAKGVSEGGGTAQTTEDSFA
jgi:hypothetical protein